jgi:hypothetical protein
MEEPKNERAFAKEGQLIKAVEELKPGDIIGINHTNPGNYQDARIYFVEDIDLEPSLKGMTLPPTAYLKRPHIGVNFSDSLSVVYAYIHVPSPGEGCKTFWNPLPKNATGNTEEFDKDKTYLIKQGLLYELGQLISSVELPSWAFMFQSNNPQETKDVCMAVRQEFANARAVHSKITQIFEQHQRRASDRMRQERK